MSHLSVVAAKIPGFYHASGNVEKGTADKINIPAMGIEIGGRGLVVEALSDVDPLSATNNDGTFAAWAHGTDYYIYACHPALDTNVAKILFSLNSTYPDGETADSSRKVGGFHYGRVRGVNANWIPVDGAGVEYGAEKILIEDCEDAWNESVDADVTSSADTADYKVGAASAKLVVADAAVAGDILATEAFTAIDLSGCDYVELWIKCSIAAAKGDLQLLLDETANCASPSEEMNIPALTADTWKQALLPLIASAADLDAIISAGAKYVTDIGACTIRIDDVQGLKTWRQNVSSAIIPNAVWDMKNRPVCSPEGMARVGNIWIDIYIASVDAAISLSAGKVAGGTTKSKYNATPLTGTEYLSSYHLNELAIRTGKRMLSLQEWLAAAEGSPEGEDIQNKNAWTATGNTARSPTGTVERAVSAHNITDCVGNIWEWLDESVVRWDDTGAVGQAWAWRDVMPGHGVGRLYMYEEEALVNILAGGYWADGVYAGSRCVTLSGFPWLVNANIGCRFACDSL